jgi:hypothetical protein
MIFLLILRFFIHRKKKINKYKMDGNVNFDQIDDKTYKQLDLKIYDDEHPNLNIMVCSQSFLQIINFGIYRKEFNLFSFRLFYM